MSLWASISRHLTRVNKPEPAQLIIFFVAAALLTFIIADNRAAAEVLFQSPVSPPAQEPPPPAQEPPPAQQPPVEQQPPAEQQPQPANEAVAPVPPAAESPSSAAPAGSEPPPLPPPTPDPRVDRTNREDPFLDEGDEAGTSNLIWDWVELVDWIVVSGAYLWLCCGAILLLLIPLVFLFLQIRGQIKLQQQDRL